MNRLEKFNFIISEQQQHKTTAEIAKSLNTTPAALRSFMNRLGYKSVKEIFIPKDVPRSVIPGKHAKHDEINEHNLSQPEEIIVNNGNEELNETVKINQNKIEHLNEEHKEELNFIYSSTMSSKIDETESKLMDRYIKRDEQRTKIHRQPKCEVIESDDERLPIRVKMINTEKPFKSNEIVDVTQDHIDLLNNLTDWYLSVKDCKELKSSTTKDAKEVQLDPDIVKEIKSTSIKVDKDIWEDFERLCSNSRHNKSDLLSQALKDFVSLYKHLM